MKEKHATFQARLRQLVEQRGLTQAALRDLTGASAGAVNSWLKDGILPRGENLLQLCERLQVSADWLLTGRGSPYFDREDEPAAPDGAPAGAATLERDRFWKLLEEIKDQYSDERERALAWDSVAANLRALASVEAEGARRQAERAREEEARAARQRAEAAIEDARSRKLAEERALVKCRGTTTADGRKGLDELPPPEEQPGSGR